MTDTPASGPPTPGSHRLRPAAALRCRGRRPPRRRAEGPRARRACSSPPPVGSSRRAPGRATPWAGSSGRASPKPSPTPTNVVRDAGPEVPSGRHRRRGVLRRLLRRPRQGGLLLQRAGVRHARRLRRPSCPPARLGAHDLLWRRSFPRSSVTDPPLRQSGRRRPYQVPGSLRGLRDPELIATPARVSAETGMNASPTASRRRGRRRGPCRGHPFAGAHRIFSALLCAVDVPTTSVSPHPDMLQGAVLGGRCREWVHGRAPRLAQLVGRRTRHPICTASPTP